MAQKGSLKQMRISSESTTMRIHMVPEALPRKKDEGRIQRRPPQGTRQGRQRIRRKTLLQEKERQV